MSILSILNDKPAQADDDTLRYLMESEVERRPPPLPVLTEEQVQADYAAQYAAGADICPIASGAAWGALDTYSRRLGARRGALVSEALSQAWLTCEAKRKLGREYDIRRTVMSYARKLRLSPRHQSHQPGDLDGSIGSAKMNGKKLASKPAPSPERAQTVYNAIKHLLSEAECNVIECALLGADGTVAIAARLNLTPSTVSYHFRSIREKLAALEELPS